MTHVATIAIQSSQVTADLDNYRLDVDLSNLGAPFWDSVDNGGGKIRCYKNDGTTELPREVASCLTASDTGQLHIRFLGDVLAASNTLVQIHVVDGASEPAATATFGRDAVWSDDYYVIVHGNDLTTESRSGKTISQVGTVSTTTGPRSGTGAISIDANNSGLRVDVGTFGDVNRTLQAWGRQTVAGAGGTRVLVGIADPNVGNDQINIRFSGGNESQFNFAAGGSFTNIDGSSVSTGWHMMHLVIDSDGAAKTMYANGASVASTIVGWNPAGVDRLGIGISADSTPFGGDDIEISGVRFRLGELSAAWIAAEYINQSAPTTFYNVTDIAASGDIIHSIAGAGGIAGPGGNAGRFGGIAG